MTIRLYYTHNNLELATKVLSTIYDENKELYKIEVEETIFHPKGGGQDQDIGFINDYPIIDVEMDGAKFYYYLTNELEVGQTVKFRIDSATRTLNSRRHSLGHVIGYILEKKMWIPIKASHYPDDCKVVFKRTERSLDDIEISDLTREVENILSEDYEKSIYYQEQKRVVSFGGKVTYMCGGTHVDKLSEIGDFSITKTKIKKDNLTVSYSIN
ncbi:MULTISPECIES: alanyl-tRNA editing protein [Pseudomonadota]|jgi:Ser-tRNA(Ala) deacylase AlaX|nr:MULTISPECIES: hypothetical protein [Pseudomonadota]QQV11433.1 hypothetical protein I6I49_20760 [Acinetobacter johnsonii]QQV17731.1 hypothetical protein I6I48_32190 [Achromobacter xylosoxidans]